MRAGVFIVSACVSVRDDLFVVQCTCVRSRLFRVSAIFNDYTVRMRLRDSETDCLREGREMNFDCRA